MKDEIKALQKQIKKLKISRNKWVVTLAVLLYIGYLMVETYWRVHPL